MKINYLIVLCIQSIFFFCLPKADSQRVNFSGFELSLPTSMRPTEGLNQRAILQYKDTDRMIYTFVIETTKKELIKAGIVPNFEYAAQSNIQNFNHIFGKGLPKTILKNINGFRATTLEHEGKTAGENPLEVSFVNAAFETPNAYYEVSAWSVKPGNLESLRAIVYSFREIGTELKTK